uniref:Uncharacterized protein n=2 Tax=Canidae TaxID=9608 RepID=A0A8C0JX84_CANLU
MFTQVTNIIYLSNKLQGNIKPPQIHSPKRGITVHLWGIYHLATDRNDFWRHLIVIVELFAMGVWLARNLKDIDPMAPQPGV